MTPITQNQYTETTTPTRDLSAAINEMFDLITDLFIKNISLSRELNKAFKQIPQHQQDHAASFTRQGKQALFIAFATCSGAAGASFGQANQWNNTAVALLSGVSQSGNSAMQVSGSFSRSEQTKLDAHVKEMELHRSEHLQNERSFEQITKDMHQSALSIIKHHGQIWHAMTASSA